MRTATIIGSGPNGLTAAIVLARAGVRTTVLEAQPTIGGGVRSAALTLPGFVHDVGSAVHPLAVSSSVFRTFPLLEHGLTWIHSPSALAHPLDDGTAVLLERSIDETIQGLGADKARYRWFTRTLAAHWDELTEDILAPLHWPKHLALFARFSALAPWPASGTALTLFESPRTQALFAGIAAHSFLPLERMGSAAFGWVLSLAAHAVGWPIPKGGSQKITDALASYLRSLGGQILPDTEVRSLDDIRDADAILCDITPRQFLRIAGHRLSKPFQQRLEKYRYGPGVFKMDWALSAPIPWKSDACRRAATVHVGGTLEEIAESERAPWEGKHADLPFVLLAQPSLFDDTRAPAGQHTAWAYCHVPNGSREDRSSAIENQIERFAPGFKSKILARHSADTAAMETNNANLVGGDINGGALDLTQLFLRPTSQLYRTPLKRVYLCSSSTPPGGGVHGLCGAQAARAALEDARG